MPSDEWFRSEVWNRSARREFEDQLAKRSGQPVAQYLRIQGLTLLESSARRTDRPGISLLERVIADHPEASSEVAGAHEHLALYFQERDDFDRAVEHYRRSIEAERNSPNQQWGCDLALAALLASDPDGKDDAEASVLLDQAIARSEPIFAQLQLRYLLARSRVEDRTGPADRAAAYALGVLEMLSDAPDDVSELRELRAELHETASHGNAAAASPLVEEYRGTDGEIRWIWPLVSQLHAAPAPGEPLPDAPERLFAACEAELRAAGFETFHLYTWSVKSLGSTAEVRRAAEILLRWFAEQPDGQLRAAIAGALTDTRARRVATGPLLDAFGEVGSPALADTSAPMTEALGIERRLKTALGSALATLARDPEFDRVAELVRDRRHGGARAYLFWAIGYMKNPAAVDLCLELLDDPEMEMPAIHALADLRSIRARPVLAEIAQRPTTGKRNDEAERQRTRVRVARHALDKLDRAIAEGKARP